ncbi:hypothetical protein LPJ69_004652 [Coemansia sp. RSA 1752]|nr:hypothetical protein LPJ69_004652 [Coemansia sp. RSA 1752]KAJ1783832.1 hypothetical protein LPJ67_004578 [Coemansia sp. RSA 1938]
MDEPDIAEPTDDVDEEPIEDPDVAAAASRLVPQVDVLRRSDSGRPGASIRVNSTASFLSQYSEEYEDEDDEDIDQETLAIMHDMEEVQRL